MNLAQLKKLSNDELYDHWLEEADGHGSYDRARARFADHETDPFQAADAIWDEFSSWASEQGFTDDEIDALQDYMTEAFVAGLT